MRTSCYAAAALLLALSASCRTSPPFARPLPYGSFGVIESRLRQGTVLDDNRFALDLGAVRVCFDEARTRLPDSANRICRLGSVEADKESPLNCCRFAATLI
jgi:hypothetical protein